MDWRRQMEIVGWLALAVVSWGLKSWLDSKEKDRIAKIQKANNEHEQANIYDILNDVCVAKEASYYSWNISSTGFEKIYFFDAETPYFAILTDDMRYKLSLKDITSHEVEYTYHIQTKKGSSGVKRAIVGGILAGGVGAVVGGVTAGSDSESQKIIDSVSVKLEIDNLQFHTVYIPCISIEVARDVEGIIRVIKHKYENSKQQ